MGVPLERASGLFGTTSKFESEFPTIDDAIIHFTESDFGNALGMEHGVFAITGR
jgi:hypothetical protein